MKSYSILNTAKHIKYLKFKGALSPRLWTCNQAYENVWELQKSAGGVWYFLGI